MNSLDALEFLPYLEAGQIPEGPFLGKVGVYAIFDGDRTLQYIGFSRDIYFSLKQHLTRRPQSCHWVKQQLVDRPSRTALEAIRQNWIAAWGSIPVGNGADEALWAQAIDAKTWITPAEQAAYEAADDAGKIKVLKQLARRVEEEIKASLTARGVTMALRFDPKLKEQGLLTLK
ncbi:MAG: GIY-YIG nuclease family protein [Synechococcales cyanobacterium RU_4_20]|nr:GIY-YIG nuclease family protein [Synechococcales cyanobacterium RU_4_20]NJR69042.1 GIY-YIG nuclease family protein [Synechococcales cyanobacterium CRU_2_2]